MSKMVDINIEELLKYEVKGNEKKKKTSLPYIKILKYINDHVKVYFTFKELLNELPIIFSLDKSKCGHEASLRNNLLRLVRKKTLLKLKDENVNLRLREAYHKLPVFGKSSIERKQSCFFVTKE